MENQFPKPTFAPNWAEAAVICLVAYLVGANIAANIFYTIPAAFYWAAFPGLASEELVWARYMCIWAFSIITQLGLIASWTTKRNSFDDVFNFTRPKVSKSHFILMFSAFFTLTMASDFSVGYLYPAQFARDGEIFKYLFSSPMATLAIFTAVIVGPFSEEVMFRGFLLPAFAKTRLGFSGAILITVATWTLLHYQYSWPGLATVFLSGIWLSILRVKTGSLWPSIALHSSINAAITTLYMLAPSHT
jgi:membrane protease YdiL (CAAX protease family)